MAGDWIKIEKATARKPEILRIADMLSIHPDHAFGLCVRFWMWVDDQFEKCNAQRVTFVTLDSVFGNAGFAKSLVKVGWLVVENDALVIPNFDRHLSRSAKKRANTGQRVKKLRNDSVTQMKRSDRYKSVTREEKRREEKNKKNLRAKTHFSPPSLSEVRDHVSATGAGIDSEHFHAHHTSKGWAGIRDWKAAVVTWKKNQARFGNAKANGTKSVEELYGGLPGEPK